MFKTLKKLKKKNIPWALAFFVLKIRKIIQIIYQNNVVEKTCLLYRRRRKKHYVLIKGFNRFMHDHLLDGGRKFFFVVIVYVLSLQKKF